jgi:hypothetical protein
MMIFVLGDYLAGMAIGALTALAVRVIVWPGMDMVLAMLTGMGVGMALHLVVGLMVSPLLGMFETMIPASMIGMYGGMLFGMRDSMAGGSKTLGTASVVGAVFGAVVVLLFHVYDRILRGPIVEIDE